MKPESDQNVPTTSSKTFGMEEDRISKLPDEILHNILSKIDIKQAVETSILSKRWKNLWSSMPDLDFNFQRLAIRSDMDLDWFNHSHRMPYFRGFVIQFLARRDDSSTIRKFQLASSTRRDTDPKLIERCLDYSIDHGVQHIDLDAYCSPTPFRLPDELLSCKTIRVLKLRQCSRSIAMPKPFVVPNLKTLYLDSFKFEDDDDDHSFPREPFSSSFPELEKLTLHNCKISGLVISASKLRILEISFQGPVFSYEQEIEHISTPELISFKYEGYVSLVCRKVDFPCLAEIYVDIFPKIDSGMDDIKKKMPVNSVRMLQQLGNAKFVTLTLDTIEVLALDPDLLEQSPSPFPYVKCLKVTTSPHRIQQIKTVPETVMNYLTKGAVYGNSLMLE